MNRGMNNRREGAVVFGGLLLTMIVFVAFIFRSGMVPGIDPEVDRVVAESRESAYRSTVKEGLIYDSFGDPVTAVAVSDKEVSDKEASDRTALDRSVSKGESLNRSASEERREVTCLYPAAYNWIGYSSRIYGKSDFRLLHEDQLFTPSGDTEIYLTTQNDLQCYTYNLLSGHKGAVVVMENRTGRILAMAGRSSALVEYDVNSVDQPGRMETYGNEEGFMLIPALCTDVPGSVFKTVTAVSLAENGLSGFTFTDTGKYNDVVNANVGVFGDTDLRKAVVESVNTYFAAAMDQLGARKLEKTARKFMIGEELQLDFGLMTGKLDLGSPEEGFPGPDPDRYMIEATGFGQGNTLITPVQMAMIFGAVVTEGTLVKPHVIDRIVMGGEETEVSGTEVLSTDFDPAVMQEVKGYLHDAALDYGFDEEEFGRIYAKTGTAEHDGTAKYHSYLVASDEEITAVISISDTEMGSYDLIPAMKELLHYIHRE